MKCPKCGKELNDEFEFCTNCGIKIQNIENKDTKEFKIKFNHLILIIIGIIILFSVIIVLLLNIKNHQDISSNNASIQKDDETYYKYITQDSRISPTGKEFIGTFTDNLTQTIETNIDKNYTKILNYNTSINNLSVYAQETYLDNLITKMKDKVVEQQYYYNAENNKIIGYKFRTTSFSNFISSLNANNYTLDEYENIRTNASINIFRDLHNYRGTEALERAQKYTDYWTNKINENGIIEEEIDINNTNYRYRTMGDVLIIVNLFNNNNGLELLYLAYDLNSNPKDIIQKWYDCVWIQENNGKNDNLSKSEITKNAEEQLENQNTIDVSYQINVNNIYIYIDNEGYVIEQSKTKSNVPIIQGIKTNLKDLLNSNRLCNEDISKLYEINKIVKILKKQEIYNKITKIIIEGEYVLYSESQKKYIYIGDATDIELKIKYAKGIMEKEQGSGNIYLNGDLKNGFKPYFRAEIITNNNKEANNKK